MDRREFLKRMPATVAVLAGVSLPLLSPLSRREHDSRPLHAQTPRRQLMRAIPGSGENIPAIGMGTYISFDARKDSTRRAALREVLSIFYQAGGRLIDSSPMYGSAEAVFGELSSELRLNDQFFVATKVWIRGAANGQEQMRNSLRKLDRKKIELMQIHNLLDWRTHYRTLRKWKEAGRFRYIGVTHYTPAAFGALEATLKAEPFDFVQLPYSVATRAAEESLLPLCQDRGIGVIVNRPYEGGDLFRAVRGKPLPAFARDLDCESYGQLFLKFLLAHPAVTCVIPATSKARHMRDNMGAGLGQLPNARLRERIAGLIGHSS